MGAWAESALISEDYKKLQDKLCAFSEKRKWIGYLFMFEIWMNRHISLSAAGTMRIPAAEALNYTNGLLKSAVSIHRIQFRLLSAESAIEIFHSAPSDKAARSFVREPFSAVVLLFALKYDQQYGRHHV